ncbi:hypothetical protein NQ317_012766 [Molorchus minor]|uniref:Enkurin domain-containing protein n=1 Tax=Molorchus minor TaxID=1323400 RepID=A0ABQ9K3G0_9CUCU|nr:hypothetical protein NQ317_012766 [Molorchus minor]
MSVILITEHNENIYDVTKVEPKYIRKRVYFKSRHSNRLNKFYKKCVKLHATMGVAEEEPPDPSNYLKKRTEVISKFQVNPHTLIPARSPPKDPKPKKSAADEERNRIPTVEELRKQGRKEKSDKNFVSHNIKLVKEMKPKEPIPKLVIDRTGTKKPLSGGLEPVFIMSEEFGKPPHYLLRFVKKHNKQKYLEKDTEGLEKPKCRYITKEERDQLLAGLKYNWEELQKQFQGLPILTDTIPKRNRKVRIEEALKQIEKDIVLVERHPYIWVYDDDVPKKS